MSELRIELPNYEGRRADANTIALLANQYGLEYDASVNPILSVTDLSTDEVILTSPGVMRCYVSGDEASVGQFMEELKNWITKF